MISEDHEWGKWVQSEGFVIKYVADAVVAHYHHFDRLSVLWARHRDEGRGLYYIHGGRLGVAAAVYRYVREVTSDTIWLWKQDEIWPYVASSIVRRCVKHAALYWGWRVARQESPSREKSNP